MSPINSNPRFSLSRLQSILLAILALQVVAAAIVYWPRQTVAEAGAPLLGELEPADIASISFIDQEQNQVKLARRGEGWVLPEAGDFPADASKIDPVIEKLVAIQTGRLVTHTPASHTRLQVADVTYQRKVLLETQDGRQHTLYLGTSSGARATHVRLGGTNEVYLTGELTSLEANPAASNWIDQTYLSIPADQVNQVVLENVQGRFEFIKDQDGNWTMQGLSDEEEFDIAKLTSLINRLVSLRMSEPLGVQEKVEYGMDQPGAAVTLIALDSNNASHRYTIRIGAQTPDLSGYVVHSSESAYYVIVSNFNVEDAINRTREDFLAPPPAPTPEATATSQP